MLGASFSGLLAALVGAEPAAEMAACIGNAEAQVGDCAEWTEWPAAVAPMDAPAAWLAPQLVADTPAPKKSDYKLAAAGDSDWFDGGDGPEHEAPGGFWDGHRFAESVIRRVKHADDTVPIDVVREPLHHQGFIDHDPQLVARLRAERTLDATRVTIRSDSICRL